MKVEEAETFAKGARVVVAFVISRQDPDFVAKRFQIFAAAVEIFAKCGKIARRDVDVGGLRDQLFERARIAMDIAEDQNFHGGHPRDGGMRVKFSMNIPFCYQPSSTTLPAESNTTT